MILSSLKTIRADPYVQQLYSVGSLIGTVMYLIHLNTDPVYFSNHLKIVRKVIKTTVLQALVSIGSLLWIAWAPPCAAVTS